MVSYTTIKKVEGMALISLFFEKMQSIIIDVIIL